MGLKFCKFKRNNNFQVGSVLDRVISQASNEDQCLLYKLANYKKGGELMDAYNIGGQIEVEKLIREQFGILMYGGGKGQIINRAEYLRWKFRDHDQVVLPIEASLSIHDPLSKWEDHEACWQMQYRGSLGETLLHVLIICDTKTHTKLARILIKCFPKLAMDVIEGEEYLGASSLHMAIAYNNNELVQDLVEAGCNVNQRAIGSFFLPRDQQRSNPAKHTDYEGLAYLGEYPLAWAACCANESVYNLLLDSGAHPDLKDNFGNMILHMVVVCDKLDMFGYALRHPKLPASNGIINTSGLTPLTLACKLGRAEVFREMLELSAKEFWRYSNITCSAYPLNALDTLLPDGRTNWNSALFIILNGTKEEHLDMLDGGIIQRLLEEKWKTFARNQFLKRLLILFVHLLFLSSAVYMRPTQPDEPLLSTGTDATDILRYACEIGTILGVLSYVVLQQGEEIKNQGLFTFLKQQSHAPAKAIFLISNLLILACIPCRLTGDQRAEEAILVFAVPGSWFLLMFFAGAVRLTGPFVTMIYSMITGDMLTFGIIYTVVLFGFSQSFYFLYKGFPSVQSTLYNSYATTWMALFQITLGDYNYAELANTTYPVLSKTVFALFMVFVPILLLNMLIAMMGNTYAHVIEQSEKEWMKQWAKIVVTLERAVAQADAHKYLEEYSIGLGPSLEDPTIEQRAVMVIKSKSKTRAKQRKGAVANWKRVGKVTITELKKRGMSGEELRCLMWGRESITTPVKVKKCTADLINPIVATNNDPNCFGGALTSALDVMTFTYDVDTEAPPATGPEIPPPHPKPKPLVNMTADGGASMFSALNQLADSQGINRPATIPVAKPATSTVPVNPALPFNPAPSLNPTLPLNPTIPLNSSLSFNPALPLNHAPSINPTLSLNPTVLIPNQINSQLTNKLTADLFVDPMRELVLNSLKKHFEINRLLEFASQAANLQNFEVITQKADISMTNLAGLFSGTDNFIKKVEDNLKKKSPLIDPSDSDSFENAILGRLSRTRRAISANIRNISARSKGNKKLIESRSESNSSLDSHTNINIETTKPDDELDYAMERMTMIKESLKQTLINNTEDTLKPVYIIPIPGSTQCDETSERISTSEEEFPKHHKSKKRSRTAKTNRVTPTVDISPRRGVSAEQKPVKINPESPPNPLQPWSVQGISNMNTILAWENEINSE